MKRLLLATMRIGAGVLVLLIAIFMALASYYWLGWPDWLRLTLAVVIIPVLAGLWFLPGDRLWTRRAAVLFSIAVFFTAYSQKEVLTRTFVPLHERIIDANFSGDVVEIVNFRDAIHPVGAPAQPRWTTRSFNLGELTGAQLVYQPFGNSAATVHVMMTFAFQNGDQLAVSFEARRTSWDKFDALAGFFRHDQLYPVLGTERDLLWKRLAHVPPNELYFFDIEGTNDEIRAYLRRLLEFVAELHDRPQFYSTVSESCFTTLIKLSPQIQQVVPWYDLRRWVPGASVGLLQELGVIESDVSEETLMKRQKLGPGVKPPWEFENANAWSRHVRSRIGVPGTAS
ncbi:MAG: DUF4105 domain-containing protein [Roseibium sp.]|uniref:lipoprotein N-acyltransferase Lnb domain-containing protein n=1 Tax=Roseibium sp. TaxID=1936156 RepID=UPI003D9C1E8B